MSDRDDRRDQPSHLIEPLASGPAGDVPWAHPALARLGEAARLIYACLVDGRSDTAQATLRGVDVVWKNRYRGSEKQILDRESFDEIRIAVQELVDAGLVLLRDSMSVRDAWVRRPWDPASIN